MKLTGLLLFACALAGSTTHAQILDHLKLPLQDGRDQLLVQRHAVSARD